MKFGQFLVILRARSRLIFTTILVTLAATAAITLLLPKRYDATASVVINPRSATPVGAANAEFPRSAESIVSTHLDILDSPNVALRVVDTLKLQDNPQAVALLAAAGPLGKIKEQLSNLLSNEQAEPSRSARDWMANRLLRHLKLTVGRDSRLIKVTYSSPDPEFSAAAANAFVRAYLESLLQLRVNPVRQDEARFDKQLKDLKGKLEEAQNKVTKFQQEKGIVATDERMDVENLRLADLSTQLVAAQAQTYASQARQRGLRAFLSTGAGQPPPEVLNSAAVQHLKQQVSEREASLVELSQRLGPNHPVFKAATADLKRARNRLKQEMRIAAEGYLAQDRVAGQSEGAIKSTLERQRAKVFKLKADRTTLAMLVQDVDSARRAYNNALDRYTQTKAQSDIDSANGSILDSAAVPTSPASPKISLNLAMALGVGLMLGIGAALYAETSNRYVRSEQDLVEIFDLPVLAVMSRRQGAQRRAPQPHRPSTPRVYALPRG